MRGRPTCSYPGAMWSHLVGEQREAHVRALLDALDLTTESGPTAVLLTSPAGWGKTRLVHEFYERIASPQSQKYWPPEITSKSDDVGILQRRKVTHPGTFTVQTNSYPEWMWWGLLAGRRDDGTLFPAIRTDDIQWYNHAAALQYRIPLARRLAKGTARLPNLIPIIGSVLGCFIPAFGIASAAQAVATELWHDGKRWMELRKTGRSLAGSHEVNDDPEPGTAPDLADAVLRLSQAMRPPTPIIVFLEDAHLLDHSTSKFILRLMSGNCCPVLLILTAQSDELAAQMKSGTGLARVIADIEPAKLQHIDLAPLENSDLRHLVLDRFPDTSLGLVDALVDRYAPNPLAIELALSLDVVISSANEGALQLAIEDIRSLPYTIDDLYAEKWRALPGDVRTMLALATIQGRIFHLKPLCTAAALVNVPRPENSIGQAADPYHWIRDWADIDTGSKYFAEEVLLHLASDKRSGQIGSADWAAARQATAVAISAMRSSGELATLDDTLRFGLLKTLVEAAFDHIYEDVGAAAEAALDLCDIGVSNDQLFALSLQSEEWLKQKYGTANAQTLEAGVRVASALVRLNQREASQRKLETIITAASGLRPNPSALYSARELLGNLIGMEGDQLQARELIQLAADGFDADGAVRDALRAKSNLANICVLLGDFTAGLELNQEVLSARETELGDDSLMTVVSRRNVARSWAHLGYYLFAIQLMFKVRANFDSMFGPQHEESILAEAELGSLMASMTDYEDGVPLLRSALSRSQQCLGSGAQATFKIAIDLACCLAIRRDDESMIEVSELLDYIISGVETNFGANHFARLNALALRAQMEIGFGNLENACSDFGEAAEGWANVLGPLSVECLKARAEHYRILAELGNAREAFTSLSAYVSEAETRLGETNPAILEARLILAAVSVSGAPAKVSMELIERAVRLSEGSEELIRGLAFIAHSFQSIDMMPVASGFMSRALELAKNRYGENHTVTNSMRNSLAALNESASLRV